MMTYSYSVNWGRGNKATVSGCESTEEAKERAWRLAFALGYRRQLEKTLYRLLVHHRAASMTMIMG
jgi:hypothetical protein